MKYQYEYRNGKHGCVDSKGRWRDSHFLTERRARIWINTLNSEHGRKPKLVSVIVRGVEMKVSPDLAEEFRKKESEMMREDWNKNRVD